MTAPNPDTLEREQAKLYLTDAELVRWLGVPDKIMRAIRRMRFTANLLAEKACVSDRRGNAIVGAAPTHA